MGLSAASSAAWVEASSAASLAECSASSTLRRALADQYVVRVRRCRGKEQGDERLEAC